jgi:hypothetical protein
MDQQLIDTKLQKYKQMQVFYGEKAELRTNLNTEVMKECTACACELFDTFSF